MFGRQGGPHGGGLWGSALGAPTGSDWNRPSYIIAFFVFNFGRVSGLEEDFRGLRPHFFSSSLYTSRRLALIAALRDASKVCHFGISASKFCWFSVVVYLTGNRYTAQRNASLRSSPRKSYSSTRLGFFFCVVLWASLSCLSTSEGCAPLLADSSCAQSCC